MRVQISPSARCRLSSSGRARSLYLRGSPFEAGRRLRWAVAQLAELRFLVPPVPGSSPGRPAHACLVIMAARRHGKAAAGVRFPEQALCGRGAGGSASPPQGEGRGFDPRRPLHVTVVSAVSIASSPSCRGPVRIRSVTLDAVLAQPVEASRSGREGSEFESRVRHAVRRGDHDRTGLRVPGGSPVPAHRFTEHWHSGYCNALLWRTPSGARVRVPHAPRMEDEPGRCPAPAGNGVVPGRAWESGSPSSAVESEPARVAAPPRKRVGVAAAGRDRRSLPTWMVNRPGGRRRLKRDGARKRLGVGSSTFRWPRPSRSTGPV